MAQTYIDLDFTFQQQSDAGYLFTATSTSGEARGCLPNIMSMPEYVMLTAQLARHTVSEAEFTHLGTILFDELFQALTQVV